jgi:LysM repeat protein
MTTCWRIARIPRVRLAPALIAGALCWPDAGCNAPRLHSSTAPVTTQAAPAASPGGESNLPAAAGAESAGERALYHQVRAGESLEDVAGIYGLSASRLLQVNGLDSSHGLQPGQLIYIPRSH